MDKIFLRNEKIERLVSDVRLREGPFFQVASPDYIAKKLIGFTLSDRVRQLAVLRFVALLLVLSFSIVPTYRRRSTTEWHHWQ